MSVSGLGRGNASAGRAKLSSLLINKAIFAVRDVVWCLTAIESSRDFPTLFLTIRATT
jgi:hypothetical protein